MAQMGWDVMLLPAVSKADSKQQLLEGSILGSRSFVIEIIKKCCPDVQFDEDESFGAYDDGDSCIGFIVGNEDPVTSIRWNFMELYMQKSGCKLSARRQAGKFTMSPAESVWTFSNLL